MQYLQVIKLKNILILKSLQEVKKIISIFTSSDDEYRYIGSDWGQHVILNQVQEILKLNSSELKNQYTIVVKMHPNQKYIHKSDASEYKKLSNEMIVLFS